ncbi:recombinase family protein [Clostridium sp. BNL1100]|uniref:recombinase family protein n=1 Tax=Clostridium sp. BNL1100 TaxID=755731 RepID=UPI00024A7916|nr:recombinase family protein [Clostridium sp. BNL1100]AEY65666.1 site-specific recombinase, DNA invertase Pin [Clostridium sp. BNL1100]
MRAAIYSRKSRFTGRGESIENQIQMCKEYAINNIGLSENEFLIFEDEGFSGGNTNRPEFKQMMREARSKKIDIVICYRLDRISRNVSDFSQLINELEKYNVSFISVKEQFDTTKPMGRAMMYIASVFSQLERETIAERIRDNMLQLAKTGRWLGGVTPTGYKSEMLDKKDSSLKQTRIFRLKILPEEAELVKDIYDKFIIFKSITKVEKNLLENRLTTKNGVDFSRFSLRFLLTNPVYAIADEALYHYLSGKGYEVYSDIKEFNGVNGLMAYNKTRQGKNTLGEKYRDPKDWVIAVGMHPGIIPSGKWIEVQKLLQRNKTKAYRNVKNTNALLSGILKCENCGSFMRPKTMSRVDSEGKRVYYYICELKEKSNKTRCDTPNINGNLLDSLILERLISLIKDYYPAVNPGLLLTLHDSTQTAQNPEIKLIKGKLMAAETEMKNLIRLASKQADEKVQSLILKRMENISKDINIYTNRIKQLDGLPEKKDIEEADEEKIIQILSNPGYCIMNLMDIKQKREILKSLIEFIAWDCTQVKVWLNSRKMLPECKDCK